VTRGVDRSRGCCREGGVGLGGVGAEEGIGAGCAWAGG